MMFKILILQRLYNIGDAQAEYQIKDRVSFMRFLGPALCDTIPDEKTIGEFREQVIGVNIVDTIFYRFRRRLEEKEVITYRGSIIDATFVDVPLQRNSRKENETIKERRKQEQEAAKGCGCPPGEEKRRGALRVQEPWTLPHSVDTVKRLALS